MFYQIFSIVGMLLLSVGAQHSEESAEEVACSQCMHMSYELSNMPALYRMILDSVFSELELSNTDCVSNLEEPESCAALTYPGWMENKCSSTSVTLTAVGITGILPDAEMTVTVVVRDCIAQWIGESSDGCTNLEDLDAATQAQITQQLQSVEASWDSVSYSGQFCITAP